MIKHDLLFNSQLCRYSVSGVQEEKGRVFGVVESLFVLYVSFKCNIFIY